MKKELRIRDGETLGDWRARLVEHFAEHGCSRDELKELLYEVSVTSYTHGSNDAISILKGCEAVDVEGWVKTALFKPEANKVVLGLWKSKKRIMPCFYNPRLNEWFEANPDTKYAQITAPSLWKEKET